MSITRRLILKGLGAAPAVAKVMMEGGALKAAEAIALNPMTGAGAATQGLEAPDTDATTVSSFADWLKFGGDAEIKRKAERVNGFDADIACLRLPVATLVRMQRRRNYERLRRNREAYIVSRLRQGPMRVWFDAMGHPDD